MKRLRKVLGPLLASLIAVPSPAQTMRVTLQSPIGAPAFSAPASFSLSAPALGAPSLALPTASLPILPAPAFVSAAPLLAAVPAALQPASAALSAAIRPAPSAPDRPDEARKADADKTFDGSAPQEQGTAVAAGPADVAPVLATPDLDRKLAALGRVPPPRPWREKGKALLAYGGLTASAVAMHAPFERIDLLIVGALMAFPTMIMWKIFYSGGQSATDAAVPVPAARIWPEPSTESLEMISRLAAEAKIAVPISASIMPGDEIQAAIDSRDDGGYHISFTKSVEALRPEVKESILRHEFGHARHHDGGWGAIQMLLGSLSMALAVTGMADKSDAMGWFAGAIAATAVLLFGASLQRSEYLADQYAASRPEGAGPLVRLLIESSKNPARAASALSGRAFSSESGWRRRAATAWDSLKRTFSAHPSHDRRIERLARLATKEAKR